MRAIFTTAVAAVALAGCSGPDSSEELSQAIEEANATVAIGSNVVSFELADVSGTMRSSDEWAGQPQLINFWATWCAPCRREIPLLKETQDEHGDFGLQVIGIAVDFAEEVEAYAAEAEFNYPILVGQEDAMAVAESSGVEFIGLPFTMVVAASGELLKTHVGEIEREHIDEIVHVLRDLEAGNLDLDAARESLSSL
jgi:peroxiredoxin